MTEEVGGGKFLDGEAPAYLQRTSVKRVRGGIILPSGEPIRQNDHNRPRSGFDVAEGDTTMCIHCQMHWIILPGSGISRGFCANCNGPTCGKFKCETQCMHFEKAIELVEGKNPTISQF